MEQYCKSLYLSIVPLHEPVEANLMISISVLVAKFGSFNKNYIFVLKRK